VPISAIERSGARPAVCMREGSTSKLYRHTPSSRFAADFKSSAVARGQLSAWSCTRPHSREHLALRQPVRLPRQTPMRSTPRYKSAFVYSASYTAALCRTSARPSKIAQLSSNPSRPARPCPGPRGGLHSELDPATLSKSTNPAASGRDLLV